MVWRAEVLKEVKHCFFGREGGVSGGKYASLNTNFRSLDDVASLQKNIAIIASEFGTTPDKMCAVRQGVSADVLWLEGPSFLQIEADAMVTATEGIVLAVKTADCAPVLLADIKHGVIAAAHAGWRGAYKGIIENTLKMMLSHGAVLQDITAAIGPCLQQDSFVVRDDMRQIILAANSDSEKYFSRETSDTYKFDLSAFLLDKLHNLGVECVESSKTDTYPDTSGYFSYRRCMHAGLVKQPKDFPTQMSCIML